MFFFCYFFSCSLIVWEFFSSIFILMQRPSSQSYRPGYLAYNIKAFKKLSKLLTKSQPPNHSHIPKCSSKSIFPNFNFSSDVSICIQSTLECSLCLCFNKSDITLQNRYYHLFLIAFIRHYLITSLNK